MLETEAIASFVDCFKASVKDIVYLLAITPFSFLIRGVVLSSLSPTLAELDII